MRPINTDTIDEIMFALLEGDIQGAEREQLLQAIEADPEYAALWRIWQNTIVPAPADSEGMNTEMLKKKRRAIVPLYIRYAAAAAIAIAAGSALYLYNESKQTENSIANGPAARSETLAAGPVRIPAGPSDSVFTVKKNDTIRQSREKFRYLAKEGRILPSESIETPVEIPEIAPVFARVPEIKPAIDSEIKPEQPVTPLEYDTQPVMGAMLADNIVVETETGFENKPASDTKTGRSVFEKLFGIKNIRIQKDGNSFRENKLIIENKKYQIIAGF